MRWHFILLFYLLCLFSTYSSVGTNAIPVNQLINSMRAPNQNLIKTIAKKILKGVFSKVKNVVKKSSAKVKNVLKSIKNKLFKRELVKRGFLSNMKDYLNQAITEPALEKFKPHLQAKLQTVHQIRLAKRNGVNNNQSYHRVLAEKITADLDETYKTILKAQVHEFFESIRSRYKNKRDIEDVDSLLEHMIAEYDAEQTQLLHKKVSKSARTDLVKREIKGFIEQTPKNSWIFYTIISFAAVPLLFNPFALSLGGIIASIAFTFFFIEPILSKLIFGTWF